MRGISIALSCALLAACTSAPPARPTASATVRPCFDATRVRSASPLDDSYVLVRVGTDEHYLLTLDAVYTSLPFATGFAISGGTSRVCGDTGDTVTFNEGGTSVSARIIRVEPVKSEAEAREVVKARGVLPKH